MIPSRALRAAWAASVLLAALATASCRDEVPPAPRPDPSPVAPRATGAAPAAVDRSEGPGLAVVGSDHHDFGRIREADGDVTHVFTLTNPSGTPVTVAAVRSSCPCIRADLAEPVVAAGASVALAVSFLPANRQGPFVAKSIVLRPVGGLPPTRLTVSADVVPRIGIDPLAASFGDVRPGAAAGPVRVTLTSRVPDLAIAATEGLDGSPFSLIHVEEVAITVAGEDVTRHVFDASFRGAPEPGSYRAVASIRTSDELRPLIRYTLDATVVGAVKVSPEQVNLRMAHPGARVEVRVDVVPTDPDQPLAITDIEVEAPESMSLVLSQTNHPRARNGHRILVSGVAPDDVPGGVVGRLRIRTDVVGQELIEVPIAGHVGRAATSAIDPALPRTAQIGALRFDDDRHDFGRVREEDGVVRHRFTFRNASDRTVRIKKVNSSCSCLVSEPAKSQYEPGEGGALEIAFDPATRQGPTGVKAITVVTDDPSAPITSVFVSADVFPRIGIEPVAAFFGEFRLGVAAPETLIVTVTSSVPGFAVERVVLPDGAPFEWTRLGTTSGEMAGEAVTHHRFEVAFAGSVHVGRLRLFARIETNDEVRSVISYPMVAAVVGPIVVDPDRVFLRMKQPGEAIEQVISIRPRDASGRFEIRSVTVEGLDDMELDVTRAPARPSGEVRLRLTGVAPPRVPGVGTPLGTITIETDAPGQETIEVPIRGTLESPRKG